MQKFKQFKKQKEPPSAIIATIRPFREFLRLESASGFLLIICIVAALVWANSPFGGIYESLWATSLVFGLGDFMLNKTLAFWISEVLMVIFFFLIGLEIKREFMIGWLSSIRQAIVPIIAATGGVVVPILMFFLINPPGSASAQGWAITAATDIAIVLGILSLFGKEIPTPLKVFVATLAIVDDIVGVLLIALFYSSGLDMMYLAVAALVFLFLIILNHLEVRNIMLYGFLGVIMWISLYYGGIHPTITGILIALTIPATRTIDCGEFKEKSNQLVNRLEKIIGDSPEETDPKAFFNTTQTLEIYCQQSQTPLQRLEHNLTPWVAFVIIPLFTLANAGLVFSENTISSLASPLAIGIILGLVIGKPLGILIFVFVFEKLGIAKMPDTFTRNMLIAAAFLCGIGFTIAIFISSLAFTDIMFLDGAKGAILLASLISSILGITIMKYELRRQKMETQSNLDSENETKTILIKIDE
ncbi:MAG: Na+/H+ antiporter NhaA [Candidatus Thorarchaeota archaeon]